MNKIGVFIVVREDTDILAEMRKVAGMGFGCFQLAGSFPGFYSDKYAAIIREGIQETGLELSTFWGDWSGPCEWNFTTGPAVQGIVPPAYRFQRAQELIESARFAAKLGATQMGTHCGFLPENMTDPEFPGVVGVLRYIASECARLGIRFLFETGQETPVALLRVIEAVGADNLGINMDTANLILYGKGNSADAIYVFGKYVRDTHIKDGFYPTDGKNLGREVKVGEGLANVPEVIRRLKAVGYKGNYIIEREISGEQQTRDILDTKAYLEKVLKEENII